MGKKATKQVKKFHKNNKAPSVIQARKFDQAVGRKRDKQLVKHSKRDRVTNAEQQRLNEQREQMVLGKLTAEEFLDGGFAQAFAQVDTFDKEEQREFKKAAKSKRMREEIVSSDDDDNDESDFDGSDDDIGEYNSDDFDDSDDDDDVDGSDFDGSDDDDDDADEKPAASKSKAASSSSVDASSEDIDAEIEEHKASLKRLQETDPEFYKYLKEEEAGLLDFEEDELEDEEDADDDDDDDDGQSGKKKKGKKGKQILLTEEVLGRWREAVSDPTNAPGRKLLLELALAFRSAVSIPLGSEEGKQKGGKQKGGRKQGDGDDDGEAKPEKLKYRITSSDVFDDLMVFLISSLPGAFNRFLGISATAAAPPKPDQCTRWERIDLIAKSVTLQLLRFLDSVTDEHMISFILRNMQAFLPYIISIGSGMNKWLDLFVRLWAHSERTPRILAFLNIMEMTKQAPYPFIDQALRKTYLQYVRTAKFVNKGSLPVISFMVNCVAELYGLDFVSSYQQAFVYIRQLAIHFRSALIKKTKQSYQSVYNWQFLNSVKGWVNVVCRYPGQAELSHLIYPLVQIIIGAVQLVPAPRFFPYRLHMVAMLNDLARTAPNLFVPVSPFLFEIVEYCCQTKAKNLVPKTPHLLTTLRFTKAEAISKVTIDLLITLTLESLLTHFVSNAASPGFPELIVPATLRLRKIAKSSVSSIYAKRIRIFADKLDQQAAFVTEHRTNLTVSPAKLSQLNALQQLGKKVMNAAPIEGYYKAFKAQASALSAPKGRRRDGDGDDDDEELDDHRPEHGKKRAGSHGGRQGGQRSSPAKHQKDGKKFSKNRGQKGRGTDRKKSPSRHGAADGKKQSFKKQRR